jgi:hypothetical protein
MPFFSPVTFSHPHLMQISFTIVNCIGMGAHDFRIPIHMESPQSSVKRIYLFTN